MKLTTALSALALAGGLASGAMAQAPREITARGNGSVEYRADSADAAFLLRLEEASRLSELEPRLDALIGPEASNVLERGNTHPTVDQVNSNWFQNIFIDWTDQNRYARAFRITVRGSKAELLAFKQNLSSIGEVYGTQYFNFIMPEGLDIQSQVIRAAEADARTHAELTANAFGCRIGELIRVQASAGRSDDYEGVVALVAGFSGRDETEIDPFVTEAKVSVTATYETLCPAED